MAAVDCVDHVSRIFNLKVSPNNLAPYGAARQTVIPSITYDSLPVSAYAPITIGGVIEAVAASGGSARDEIAAWSEDLAELDRSKLFNYGVVVFTACGAKPSPSKRHGGQHQL
jgi:hypothetical protein